MKFKFSTTGKEKFVTDLTDQISLIRFIILSEEKLDLGYAQSLLGHWMSERERQMGEGEDPHKELPKLLLFNLASGKKELERVYFL